MLVQKFGGTSMGSVESIEAVTNIIRTARERPAVIVSAMTGVTNQLLALIELALKKKPGAIKKILTEMRERHFTTARAFISDPKIVQAVNAHTEQTLDELEKFLNKLKKLTTDAQDHVLAVGERLSARMLAGVLTSHGVPAEYVNLDTALTKKFFVADGKFYSAIEKRFGELFRRVIKAKKVPVGTGYFGRVPGGMLATIGRGYSDFCAALVAAGLRADNLEIWTDVSGILSADPRKVKKARIIDIISSEAAAELAHFGAKVIHPQCIHPAIRANVPVWIKNTFRPKDRGTEIVREVKNPKQLMTAITSKKGVTIINIASYRMLMQYGFLAKVFEIFARYQTSIDVVSTSEVSVSVTIENVKHLEKIIAELKPFSKVSVTHKKAIVCLVGLGMREKQGVAGEVFSTLGRAGISVDQISQGASEINITFVVDEDLVDKAVAVLHKKFFEC